MPICKIPLHGCTSSRIHSHGYDANTKTLVLRFLNKGKPGPIYTYANVTPAQHESFMNAESMGRWFGANLSGKVKEHPFTKMDAPEEEAESEERQP